MSDLFCVLYWTLTALIIVFFLILAWRSNLLRDEIDNPAAFMTQARLIDKDKSKVFGDIPRPFSLARMQLAIWTVVVAPTYLYRMLCLKDCGSHLTLASSSTTLALLAISAGTIGAASIIDRNNMQSSSMIPRHQNAPSQGFFTDILSDESGICIHRFQNVIWTVIAIAIYLSEASAGNCALPALDGTILTLSGISSAAYLGLKINENK
jgi:hypothetical protein